MSKLADDIIEYHRWLEFVPDLVGHHVANYLKDPQNPDLVLDTDDLKLSGISLKGQDVEISRLTGNVSVAPTLLAFGHFLSEREKNG